jgi:uncharacterized Zn finger protein
MKELNPCPYCGGNVEVIKLVKREKEKKAPYRIECKKCHALVARGFKFEKESEEKGKERIKQYNDNIEEKMKVIPKGQAILSAAGKRYNILGAKAVMMSPEDMW